MFRVLPGEIRHLDTLHSHSQLVSNVLTEVSIIFTVNFIFWLFNLMRLPLNKNMDSCSEPGMNFVASTKFITRWHRIASLFKNTAVQCTSSEPRFRFTFRYSSEENTIRTKKDTQMVLKEFNFVAAALALVLPIF